MPQPIPVLYEDETIVAFDKPAGMIVIPAAKNHKKTLVDWVNLQYRQKPEDSGTVTRSFKLHPCHRLDRETSGVILFAKGKKNQQLVMPLFKQQLVKKTYVAFVLGAVVPKQGEIDFPVWDHYDRSGHFTLQCQQRKKGRPALTRYRVQHSYSDFSLVEVWPQTGRKNQIRIHFRMTGHPLLGERVYAFRKDFSVDTKRLALHAKRLQFFHPITKKRILIESPLAVDLKQFLNEQKKKT